MLLNEGVNCWRIETASRASYLLDAAAYFARFREVVLGARRSILILGWDVDSRTRLLPPGDHDEPTTLLVLLNWVLARRPELRVHVLGWDFSMMYSLEREKLPEYRFGWEGHERLLFRLDGVHPFGAAHHQKVVVVDDEVAFAGGLDLTIRRWDTPEHQAQDPHRHDPGGQPYPPMHDVQMIVEGPIARALGDLARKRWRIATGQDLPPAPTAPATPAPASALWPAGLAADLRDAPLGIARTHRITRPEAGTDPAFALPPRCSEAAGDDPPDVREVLQLTLDMIRAARRFIYIENQYLTSAAAGAALAASLEGEAGPEVVVVLPREECGWLERSTMGVLRGRLLRRLQAADRHGRLRLYHPVVAGLAAATCVNVHSKVMVVDDDLARVGSANLSNRSMGLDTECDLVVDADGDPERRRAVASLRDRLLAEHLGVAPALVAARIAERGSLIAAVESLSGNGGPRTLAPLPDPPAADEPPLNLAMLDGLVCDPERPPPDKLFDVAVPTELRRPLGRSLVRWALVLAVIAALVATWRLSPLSSYLQADRLAALARRAQGSPLAPLVVIGAYMLGAMILFPITLMLAATALVFSPAISIAYSLLGTLSAAALTFGMGRALSRWGGPRQPRWLRGPRIERLRRMLTERGLLAVVAARLLPVGSFSLINMLAGAIPIRFRDFMLGNAIGILPGVLGLSVFAHELARTVRNPHPRNLVALALLAAVLVTGIRWLRRRVGRATHVAPQGPKV